jgi:hypothetical protein
MSLEQLKNFCEFEATFGAKNKTHIAQWALEEIERLTQEADCLKAALDSTQTAENAGLAEIERLNEVLMNQRVIAHQQAMSSIQKNTAQMLSEVDYQLLKQWRK